MLDFVAMHENQVGMLWPHDISERKLPVNFDAADLRLFEHEFVKTVPAIRLLRFKDVNINSNAVVFQKGKVLPESFITSNHISTWASPSNLLKFYVANYLLNNMRKIEKDTICFIDQWSSEYFHWMTDALPRLFAVRDRARSCTVVLPNWYEKLDYVQSSLRPFSIQDIEYIGAKEVLRCKQLWLPTHAAPTGNYNDHIVKGLRSLFAEYFGSVQTSGLLSNGDRIYISRAKAKCRRIANEPEVVKILREYDFMVVLFEDYPFEYQVKIALGARYLVSNHGAGLANMLFMSSGGSILELRKKADCHNNCYFSLASALNLPSNKRVWFSNVLCTVRGQACF